MEVEAAAMNFFDRGKMDPLVGEVIPFEEIPQALMFLGSRSSRGKIVTRPGA